MNKAQMQLLVEIKSYLTIGYLLADTRKRALHYRYPEEKKEHFILMSKAIEKSMDKFLEVEAIVELKKDLESLGYSFSMLELAIIDTSNVIVAQLSLEKFGYFLLLNEVTEPSLKSLISKHFGIERASIAPSPSKLKEIGAELSEFKHVKNMRISDSTLSCHIECVNDRLFTFHIHSELDYMEDINMKLDILKNEMKKYKDSYCNYDQLLMKFERLREVA